jgi:hypothetical protein
MNYLDDLKKRYNEKKGKNEFNEQEINFLDVFLKDDSCFLRVKADEAKGIIRSLGVPSDKIMEYYQNILILMLKNMKQNQKNVKKSL